MPAVCAHAPIVMTISAFSRSCFTCSMASSVVTAPLDDRDIELFWHRLARSKLPVFKIDASEDVGEEMLLIGDLQLTTEAARQAHNHDAQRLLLSTG